MTNVDQYLQDNKLVRTNKNLPHNMSILDEIDVTIYGNYKDRRDFMAKCEGWEDRHRNVNVKFGRLDAGIIRYLRPLNYSFRVTDLDFKSPFEAAKCIEKINQLVKKGLKQQRCYGCIQTCPRSLKLFEFAAAKDEGSTFVEFESEKGRSSFDAMVHLEADKVHIRCFGSISHALIARFDELVAEDRTKRLKIEYPNPILASKYSVPTF